MSDVKKGSAFLVCLLLNERYLFSFVEDLCDQIFILFHSQESGHCGSYFFSPCV